MRVISKFAEYVGYRVFHGEKFHEWRCPNRKCGFSVSEDYAFCPYCGQKIKFQKPPKVKMIRVVAGAGYQGAMERIKENGFRTQSNGTA